MSKLSTPNFVIGQRWISNTEPELGLGIITENDNRRITISFPAATEQRTYSAANAPLSRVQYQVGDNVSDNDEKKYTVAGVIEQQGYLIYEALDEKGRKVDLPELELSSFVHFVSPKDRLFSGQVDKLSSYLLRQETLGYQTRQQATQGYGLMGARVQLLPHQMYIANEVAHRHAPRVLLADEVGLGKTIEAGLILHHQLLSGRAQRVLIVVPESLLHQWLVEMLRRFNLQFSILDNERCEALTESGEENPFECSQLVLCSLNFITDNDQWREHALNAQWDMLVVDEAHHLEWSPEQQSPAYSHIEALAQKAPGLLLLTATPEQLGLESHFARLRLLDPARYHDLERFREEESQYQPVNDLVKELLGESGPTRLLDSQDLQAKLADYLGQDAVDKLLAELNQFAVDADEDSREEALHRVERAVRKLLDQHGVGRVLFRNTRSAIKGFPQRILHLHPLPQPEELATLSASASLEQRLHPERLLGAEWVKTDSRVEWLAQWLKQNRQEKVLVICAHAETALDLEDFLRLRGGYRTAVFHEGLSLLERDRAGAYFADDEYGAQALICSEIGSEGRNFQFARHLVLFDLPQNPDLLEQRIGRLDRIGQRHDVNIHVPFFENSAQERLLRWHNEGINAFSRPCPAGAAIYQRFAVRLESELEQTDDRDEFNQLIADTHQFTEETLQALQQGRDPLLELNSCDPLKANDLVEQIVEDERRKELEDYIERVFSQYGVDQEQHSERAYIFRPGDHMQCSHFPGLPEDGVTATFHRDLALSRDDMQFLTWEHPIVTGALDMILCGEFGNTGLCTIKLPPLQPGALMVETIFRLNCPAPKALQLYRFLPKEPVRLLIDSSGKELGQILTAAHLQQLGENVPKRTAQDLVRHARAQIEPLITKAEKTAAAQKSELVERSIATMLESQQTEIERLKALAEVNPNIRQDEIDFLIQQTETLEKYLKGAQLTLDAVRVVIAT
ncbi:Superfamily II DNA/RNA helicase, SNF2 family [Hahella chejuensis KCTC 2396]|uniref:RNA polymerase-associated protein RapA n=1 Tax=Hahella chejuensis (strain KCTC 2396) TaxID=349521 RepID=Q2SC88_HAHCH|nr:RNA polymerase-associated protein RapA [Hahella chejuensis]ABC31736.1 Superfamily II DNA/RNA helicase, SNF2 family [Hahella chejuensis KCTC 2396]